MENNNILKNYLANQKNSQELKPDSLFAENLQKRLNNKIDLMKYQKLSSQSKDQRVEKSTRNILSFKKLAPYFALSLIILTIVTILGVQTYKNTDTNKPDQIAQKPTDIVTVTPTTTPTAVKLEAKEVLAAVNTKFEETKKSKVVSYQLKWESNDLNTGSISSSGYCNRLIDYNKSFQRNDCGYRGKQFDIRQELELIKEDKTYYFNDQARKYELNTQFQSELLPAAEFTPEFFEKVFRIEIDNAVITEENDSAYKIRVIWNMDKIVKNELLKIYEKEKGIISEQLYLDLEINKNSKQITSGKITYKFPKEEKLVYSYTVDNVSNIDVEEYVFDENTTVFAKDNIAKVNAVEVVRVTENNVKKFDVKFTADKDTKYIVLVNGNQERIIENISGSTTFRVNNTDDQFGSTRIGIYPYKEIKGVKVYNTGKEVLTSNSFDQVIERDTPTFLNNYFSWISLFETGKQTVVNKDRLFENSRLKVQVPESWEIKKLSCSSTGACTGLEIKKNNYVVMINTDVMITGGGFGGRYDAMCDAEPKPRYFTDKLEISDKFANIETVDPNYELCKSVIGNQKGTIWLESYVQTKGSVVGPIISRSALLGIPKPITNSPVYTDNIIINYYYDKDIEDVTTKFPIKDSIEWKAMMKEIEGIVKSIEFKK